MKRGEEKIKKSKNAADVFYTMNLLRVVISVLNSRNNNENSFLLCYVMLSVASNIKLIKKALYIYTHIVF